MLTRKPSSPKLTKNNASSKNNDMCRLRRFENEDKEL
jgi:hypothetical protein